MNKNMLISDKILETAAECLKCIAHPHRLKILDILEQGEFTVNEIVELLNISQSVTSDHLRLMHAKGILSSSRKGRNVYYKIAMPEITNILHCVRSKNLTRSI